MNREILGGGWRDEVFERVLEMRVAPHWNEIDAFMHEEYGVAWTAAILEKEAGRKLAQQ